MSYVVYWLQRRSSDSDRRGVVESHFKEFTPAEMGEALAFTQTIRREPGVRHVSMSSEDPNQVGSMGVDTVSDDGKLPDGTPYTWRKRRP